MGGFSLLEVLVTMFILVVGLLGLAAMQLNVTQANQDSYIRSQAMVIVQSLADRLRLNSQYVNRNDFTSPPLVTGTDNRYSTASYYNFANLGSCSTDPWSCYCQSIPSAIPKCRDESVASAAACSAEDLAVFDAWEMSCAGASVHPGFYLQVTCSDSNSGDSDACSPHSSHVIIASWPAATSLISSRNSLNCFLPSIPQPPHLF